MIPLILAHRHPDLPRILAVEIQPELARLARENVEENALSARIEIIEADFRQTSPSLPPQSFDLVISNPPYRKTGTGKVNPHPQRAAARHELFATLPDVFDAAGRLLPQGGRIALIFPATRIGHLLHTALDKGFSPKRLRMIHSHPNGPARLVHLECRKSGGEEVGVGPPLFIYREDGRYSEQMERLYAV